MTDPITARDALALAPWLYIGTLAALLSMLLVVYIYLVSHRGRAYAWNALEAWIGRRLPHFWSKTKGLISRAGRRRLGIAGVLMAFSTVALSFAAVADSWREQGRLFLVDQRVYEALAIHSEPAVEGFLSKLTYLGSSYCAIAVSLALLAWFLVRRALRRIVALALVMGLGEALTWGLKFLFARQRPQDSLVRAAGNAFPSGHSFTAAALYGFIIYLVWAHAKHPLLRASVTALLGTVAILVGVSRIVLRVHWFSDVLGGFTLGLGWLVCCLLLMRALELPRRAFANKAGSMPSWES